MKDFQFSVLSKLYLFGKRLHSLAKTHNSDQMGQHILLHLIADRPYTISEIAEVMSIKISAATSKVTEMESAGYLKRNRSADKRSHTVSITAKGRALLARTEKRIEKLSVRPWFGLNKKECLVLESLLRRIRLEETYAEKN
jgi:DNA-binding MarR family transcriptional regulator